MFGQRLESTAIGRSIILFSCVDHLEAVILKSTFACSTEVSTIPMAAGVYMRMQGLLVHNMRYLASVVSNCFTAFGELLALHKRFAELSGGVER